MFGVPLLKINIEIIIGKIESFILFLFLQKSYADQHCKRQQPIYLIIGYS